MAFNFFEALPTTPPPKTLIPKESQPLNNIPGTEKSTKMQNGMKRRNASTRKQLRRRREDMAKLTTAMSLLSHTPAPAHRHITLIHPNIRVYPCRRHLGLSSRKKSVSPFEDDLLVYNNRVKTNEHAVDSYILRCDLMHTVLFRDWYLCKRGTRGDDRGRIADRSRREGARTAPRRARTWVLIIEDAVAFYMQFPTHVLRRADGEDHVTERLESFMNQRGITIPGIDCIPACPGRRREALVRAEGGQTRRWSGCRVVVFGIFRLMILFFIKNLLKRLRD